MEAERVAAPAPAEPDRTSEPSTAPSLALLQQAPAAYIRRLSRTYGNRRVALALQRQPTTAAPPSPIAKGYKAVSTQDTRWQKVDDLLTWTQLGWEAREVMRKFSVPLAEADVPAGTADKGAPAFYDAGGNVCYLNLSGSPAEISAYFVHEMHHANQARTGNSPGAEGIPNTEEHRKKWVAMMVEEEIIGTAKGFEHKRRLENRGLAKKDDRPAGMGSYRRVFEHWRDQALAEGKDEVQAADAGRAKALTRVRLMIANPGGRASPELGPPGGVGESYEDFYAREFKKSPHPTAPP
jgi:hypothetical protein